MSPCWINFVFVRYSISTLDACPLRSVGKSWPMKPFSSISLVKNFMLPCPPGVGMKDRPIGCDCTQTLFPIFVINFPLFHVEVNER